MIYYRYCKSPHFPHSKCRRKRVPCWSIYIISLCVQGEGRPGGGQGVCQYRWKRRIPASRSVLLPIGMHWILVLKGLWICIHLLRIRIRMFISMRIRIQPNKICNKLPVLHKELKKTKKIAQKLNEMELVHIYLIKKKKKITISTNFLEFFLFFPP